MKCKLSASAIAVSLLMSTSALAANIVNLGEQTQPSQQTLHTSRIMPGFSGTQVQPDVKLDKRISFKLIRTIPVAKGANKYRFQEYLDDVPIYNSYVVSNSKALTNHIKQQVYGSVLNNFNVDDNFTKPDITAEQAMTIAMAKSSSLVTLDSKVNIQSSQQKSRNQSSELVIYMDSDQQAKLAYISTFTVDSPVPARPITFVNAHTGEIIRSWNSITHVNVEASDVGGNLNRQNVEASGVGGNLNRQNVYQAGKNGIPLTRVNGTCFFDTKNVRTVDLNMQGTDKKGNIKFNPKTLKAMSFTCSGDDINYVGPWSQDESYPAYDVEDDAQYFGTKIYQMYQDWFSESPIPGKLYMRVHFGKNFDNAFWDGNYMNFGDGGKQFYPLVSLDIAAHEVTHGVTQYRGKLEGGRPNCEACAINEAFSDMAGEAAKVYVYGRNNFLVGPTAIKKNPNLTKALRYFADPTKDGISFDNYQDYLNGYRDQKYASTGLNEHWGAGIFDKAFYELANTKGWNVKKSFKVFLRANESYWYPGSSFVQAACGVYNAASDNKYSKADIANAFDQVGIYSLSDRNCFTLPNNS